MQFKVYSLVKGYWSLWEGLEMEGSRFGGLGFRVLGFRGFRGLGVLGV